MDSRFLGQKVMVPKEPGEPQSGTIAGETPTLFAVRTETGDVILVEKRYAYPYDPATLQKLKNMYGKFLEAKTSLEVAWANLVPLVPGEKSHRVKEKVSDIELLEIARRVVAGQLREKQPEFTFEETHVQPLLKGYGNRRGSASGPVTIVRSVDELYRVKEGDVLVTEAVTLDWPWFQAAMLASGLIVESGDYLRRRSFSLSWEVGIPCIRGAIEVARVLERGGRINGDNKATEILIDGQIVTVDSMRGEVYHGNTLIV